MRIKLGLILFIVSLNVFSQRSIFLNKKTLVDGTGTAFIVSTDSVPFGYMTFKSGHLDGSFYHIDTTGRTALTGEVKYRPYCANYLPAIRLKYIDSNNDTVYSLLPTPVFEAMKSTMNIKILEKVNDSIVENEYSHPDLREYFGDAFCVPTGQWKWFNVKTNKLIEVYDFDECGNILLFKHYDIHGKLIAKRKYPKRNVKKKMWYK